ncbi:hypothetical protein KAR91_24755 [Candidatus Pacearchaeota archaeon]|nr:hypothetical protein [Candidatus Pacearchaeota archaeon]
MSEEDNGVINDDKKESNPIVETVARKAYEEVSGDMHKYKAKNKQLDLELSEYKAKLKTIEESKMKEQSQWQELYDREKEKTGDLESKLSNEKNLFMRSVKLQALKSELGAVKDIYLQNANIDDIIINDDGSLGSESVKSVANNFRQVFPEVIPSVSGLNITAQSPGEFNQINEKPLGELSYEDKVLRLQRLKGEI